MFTIRGSALAINNFGETDELNKNIMNIEQIAKTCHAVNVAYCKAIGDPYMMDWDDLPENLKASSIKGVEFKLANPDATPEDQHNAWSESKIADGWVYGEVKDMDKKTHPCLVPYEKLPLDQRVKDYLFQGVVKSFLG
jgi:hypothetical protein